MYENDSIRSSLPHCRCDVLRNPWAFRPDAHGSKSTHLVAYVRVDSEPPSMDEQLNAINQFCKEHGYELHSTYVDEGVKPGYELAKCMERLDRVGGLIAYDLDRFVHSKGDRIRDLKPFIHDFFCVTHKHLLTVKEGINTAIPSGQRVALDFISASKDFE